MCREFVTTIGIIFRIIIRGGSVILWSNCVTNLTNKLDVLTML